MDKNYLKNNKVSVKLKIKYDRVKNVTKLNDRFWYIHFNLI